MNDQSDAFDIGMGAAPASDPIVRQFRQIVLWPLQIVCESGEPRCESYDRLVATLAPEIWCHIEDEFGDAETEFQERHYREFVAFLPHVQRFLYGDAAGPTGKLAPDDAPIRAYRRKDVAKVRIVLEEGMTPVECEVAHIDLYFFQDVDAVILAFELSAEAIPLSIVQNIMYRFGRAYPPGWSEAGEPMHCPAKVEWIGRNGAVLAASDYENRQRYLTFVGNKRAPCIAKHWEYLLHPLTAYASARKAPLRFRQIEYYRMPSMSYIMLDSLAALKPADHVRLAFAVAPGERDVMPYSKRYLEDFDARHCYDRFYVNEETCSGVDTRFLSCGHAFTVIAAGRSPFLRDSERGLLGEFRHQQFLLFMIAHFHKAALLMISDKLVAATKLLDEHRRGRLADFRQETFRMQESFLRFTQRYYFTEVSDQAHARDLFRLHRTHLGIDELYRQVRSEIFDTVQYLDSNMLRRQSGSMHRLTSVTILGLIGTTATGFLGMNVIAEADAPAAHKIAYFAIALLVCSALTLVTVAVSQRLTRLFDRITGERDGG
jgi:hypothetical protein